MKRLTTFASLTQVPSATLNGMQDRAQSMQAANSNNDYAITTATGINLGGEGLYWQGSVTNGQLKLIDNTNDYRDRLVHGYTRLLSASNVRVGQASDINLNQNVTALSGYDDSPVEEWDGYTGTGAYSNAGTGAAVSNGNPPVNGAGAFRSYALTIAVIGGTDEVRLYCDPGTGYLYLYNPNASTRYLILRAFFTAQLDIRS